MSKEEYEIYEEKLEELMNEYRRCYNDNDEKGKEEVYKQLEELLGEDTDACVFEIAKNIAIADDLNKRTKEILEQMKKSSSELNI